MTTHAHFDELVAGYALGALDPADRDAFEAHLTTCETCRSTLAELARVSTAIGLTTDSIAPPPALRARVLERATQSGRAGAPARPHTHTAAAGWWRLAAAASVTVAAVASLYAWSLQQQLAEAHQAIAEVAAREALLRSQLADERRATATLTTTLDVLRSSDMIRVDLRAADAASPAAGRAFVSVDRGMIFNAVGLPSLGPGRTYQLWVIPAGAGAAPVSVGLLDVDAAGTSAVSVPLPASVTSVAAVAVSQEPAGGSPAPTTTPLLVGTPVNN